MRIYCTDSTISPPSDPATATPMFDRATDTRVRSAAFDWLQTQVDIHRMVPGRYLATWPVFIVQDDPGR